MICYLCGSKEYSIRHGSVRDREAISILECKDCGLVYLSSRDHLNREHYEKSGMHGTEPLQIHTWLQRTRADDLRRYNFLHTKITEKTLLDFGCGVGGFLQQTIGVTNKSDGIELELRLHEYFNTIGLNVYQNIQEIDCNTSYDIITAFHVIEHLPDPISTLKELYNLLNDNGELIIEVPNSDDALLTLYDSKKFKEFSYWSQHCYLFNTSTLSKLVKKAGFQIKWIKQVQRFPLSNHLYWLAMGKPGGHQEWSFINNPILDEAYSAQLASLGHCDTIIAGIKKIDS